MLNWRSGLIHTLLITCSVIFSDSTVHAADEKASAEQPISYYKQIRPIFQAHCQGCHQPARAEGSYNMLNFASMLKGGESETAAIVPGKTAESYLLELITPENGEAEMPKGKKPLAESDRQLIANWIAQGAVNDTPENAVQRYDTDHPPVYTRPPVITSIDFSPDGQLLAIAGFHEVLLHHADGSGSIARLIGVSERIETVRFSPDGKSLAVSGGLPARMGEIQVWDVEQRKLTLSLPVTYDTVYGASWSPDGKLIAFGCSDNTVRAIDAKTGEQVLFQGSHSDWIFDTVFSVDGSQLVSVGRDRTAKLTEVGTGRFIDNITSITPGALKGGISTVARHPGRDEILIGGADGIPRIYRMNRLTKRVIGDDANLIKKYPEMPGRIFGVDYSTTGEKIVAVSSLDGQGTISIYSSDFDSTLPKEIKTLLEKRVQSQSQAEKDKIEKYVTEGVKLLKRISVPSGLYSVSFHPERPQIAVAGSDGQVRLIHAENGNVLKTFVPIDVTADSKAPHYEFNYQKTEEKLPEEKLPAGRKLAKLRFTSTNVNLSGKQAYHQLVVLGQLDSGEWADVTRMVEYKLAQPFAAVSQRGLVEPLKDGNTQLIAKLQGQSASISVSVQNFNKERETSFIQDVNPVLSRLGCNQGTCHGAKDGKAGFKLSLRGYDPIWDVRSFTDDLASRRTNVASPDDSLMLLKATGAVPHVGGQVTPPGSNYYNTIRKWIAEGAQLNLSDARVESIKILPENSVIQNIGGHQQVRVVATYTDGATKDVTTEAYIDSGNTEVATSVAGGLIHAIRRGEAPLLARYEGAYAATTITIMGNRDGFQWREMPANNPIDKLVAEKLQRLKIRPSELCTDADFIRRVYLDVTGLPPTVDAVKAFLADERRSKIKREELIEKLVGNSDYVEYWTNKWADLLQVNRKFLGAEGAANFRKWIQQQVQDNKPYDQFAYEILTASGSNLENPAASYYKILRNPTETMENTTHLFLAIRFNCNKCHDHPFERWTQDQYYETAAYFSQFGLKNDPNSKGKRIGGTAVESAKPLYEIVFDKTEGDIKHDRTGEITPPAFPFECDFQAADQASRREQIAKWITSPDNPYFAKSYVNRLWGYLTGVGLIEPLDDIRAGNPPTNPELLDWLTQEFIKSGFNTQHIIKTICKSRTYQLSIKTNEWNEDDRTNYSHATARRLPAEVLYDAIHRATGAVSNIPGVARGTRAAALPDVGVKLPSAFLTNFGRPARESVCECERSNELQLGPVMALVSGPTLGKAISDPQNKIAKLVKSEPDNQKLINELFLRILNRPASQQEIDSILATHTAQEADQKALKQAVAERQAYWDKQKPVREQERLEQIAKLEKDLADYQKKIAPLIAQKAAEREKLIATRTSELEKYRADLAKKQSAWEQKKAEEQQQEWFLLDPLSLSASKGVTLMKQADRSILAASKADRATYTITAKTSLQNITGMRLEVLTDDLLPQSGPGLAGNYVITELEVKAASADKPKAAKAVALTNPLADFQQSGLPVSQAIDKNKRNNNGWAVSPAVGVGHWATFELKEAIKSKGETILTFTITQNHSAKNHLLGRFRFAVTTSKSPIGLGLNEELHAILTTDAKQRSDAQKQILTNYFNKTDQGLIEKKNALAEAKQPVPTDPGVVSRKKVLQFAKLPVREDQQLLQLKRALELSTSQLKNKRLTMAQDIAWALINSPAFLFNH